MSNETLSSHEADKGRDFSAIMRNESRRFTRGENLQVGDYIDIDSTLYKNWIGDVKAGDSGKLQGIIRLTVKSITYSDEAKRIPDKAVVSGGGVEKEVYASLFYNYNRPPLNLSNLDGNA